MGRITDFMKDKRFTWLLLAFGTVAILFYNLKNIPYLNTVWELVDEYGYLANAAYISGTDWAHVTNFYYGFGYSLLLVPLFWVCETGMQLVKGAIVINTCCVVVLFFVQYLLMSKIYKKANKNMIVAISLIMCFYPYLIASEMKVICEVFLTLLIWTCGLFFYQVLTTGKWYYYVLLALATVWTFLTHTRALVFCGAMALVLICILGFRKINIKKAAVFLAFLVGLFVIGYVLKVQIIDSVYKSSYDNMTNGGNVVIQNTLSISYVLGRIIDTIKNFSYVHVYSLICKNFYLLVATAGVFHLGVAVAIRDAIKEVKQSKKICPENAVKVMFVFAALLMLIALVVQSPGDLNRPTYFYYGRYYEYLVGPVAFIGLMYCVEHKLGCFGRIFMPIFTLISGLLALSMNNYIHVYEFYFDSNRIACFSAATPTKFTYEDVVRYNMIFALIMLALIIIFNMMSDMRKWVPAVVLCTFFLNNSVLANNILLLHQTQVAYCAVSAYIHTKCDVDEVYFLKSDVEDVCAYAGIQTLLGTKKLNLVEAEDAGTLESGMVFVTFKNNEVVNEIDAEYLAETDYFAIYEVE